MTLRTSPFIGGNWFEGSPARTFPVTNPATGDALAHVQPASREDMRAAAAAAHRAFRETWGPMNPYARAALLHRVGDAIEKHADFIAGIESDDVGKPIFESKNIDVASAAATFHHFADAAIDLAGDLKPSPFNEVFDYTLREPLGVVGAIIPWNFPFLIAARKIASALAAGNTIVIKPATWAPLSTLLFGEIFLDAGMPAGVLNIVPGGGGDAGAVFSETPEIEEISFTGSTEIGTLLYGACAPRLKGCTLELGGKSPALVLPDCDIDETIAGTLFGAFLNQGECCCGLTRLIVHRDIYDRFVPRFVEATKAIPVGPPRDEATRMGPLVHPDHMNAVLGYLQSARDEGATILCGGERLTHGPLAKGNFLAPAVIADVTPAMRVWKEEIFGPAVVVTRGKDVDDMIAQANDTPYGLAASIWTTNVKAAHTLVRKIHAGTVWVNLHNFVFPGAPYGGYGASGVGTELGREGLLALTRPKNVMVSLFPEGFRWY